MERKSNLTRKTKETDISAELVLDTDKNSDVGTGVPFFDHMLGSMARHGKFSLRLSCRGDREIDDHHTVEDVGIVLGQAFKNALGDKRGIVRFGSATIPMDDALCMTAVDLSGRAFFRYSGADLRGYIGDYSEELTIEFMRSLATGAGMNLHVNLMHGENRHHMHEAIFKSLGISIGRACAMDPSSAGDIPSTKGTLS